MKDSRISQNSTRALSSVYGKIEQILITIPAGKTNVSKEDVRECYSGFFNALGGRVHFIILGDWARNSEASVVTKGAFEAALLESNSGNAQHREFCHVSMMGVLDGKHHGKGGEFVQDPFVVMQNSIGTTALVKPMLDEKSSNVRVAKPFASKAKISLRPISYTFEGGNILVGDDYALIERNLLILRSKRFFRSLEVGDTLFQNKIPNGLQPFFYLDLLMVLGGRVLDHNDRCIFLQNEIDVCKKASKKKGRTLIECRCFDNKSKNVKTIFSPKGEFYPRVMRSTGENFPLANAASCYARSNILFWRKSRERTLGLFKSRWMTSAIGLN